MIAARAPYFIKYTTTNLTGADVDIRIFSGAYSTSMTSPQYSLYTTAINSIIVVEIGELIRDYITTAFDGTYTNNAVNVNYQITPYVSGSPVTALSVVQEVAIDAYTYFEEGSQLDSTGTAGSNYTFPDILQSNTTIYKPTNAPLVLPVLQDNVARVTFLYRGIETNTETVSSVTSSASTIRYLDNTGATYDEFSERVAADSGTLEDEAAERFKTTFDTHPCDAIIYELNSGANYRLNVVDICEPKYDPVKVTFCNKFGALQDMWFFKAHRVSSSVSSDKYRRTIISGGTYDTTDHVDYDLRRNMKERLILNSGFYSENYNEVFRQLCLSESVWVTFDGVVYPVRVATSNVDYKTSVNDKLTDYQLELEFAFNKLNDVR